MSDKLQHDFNNARDQKAFEEEKIRQTISKEDRQRLDQLKRQCEKELAAKQKLFDQSKDKLIQEREAEIHDNRLNNLDLTLNTVRNPSRTREEIHQQAQSNVHHYHANDLNETRAYYQDKVQEIYVYVQKKQEFLRDFNEQSRGHIQEHAHTPVRDHSQ